MRQSLTIALKVISVYYYNTTTVREIWRNAMNKILNLIKCWSRPLVIHFAKGRAVSYCLRKGGNYQTFYFEDEVLFIGITEQSNVGGVKVQQIVKRYYLDKELLKNTGGYTEGHFNTGYTFENLPEYQKPKDFTA